MSAFSRAPPPGGLGTGLTQRVIADGCQLPSQGSIHRSRLRARTVTIRERSARNVALSDMH